MVPSLLLPVLSRQGDDAGIRRQDDEANGGCGQCEEGYTSVTAYMQAYFRTSSVKKRAGHILSVPFAGA